MIFLIITFVDTWPSDAEKTLLEYIKTGECDGYWQGQESMGKPTINKHRCVHNEFNKDSKVFQ